MIVLMHVLVALCSIVYSSYLLLYPSEPGLRKSYALITATLTSGTYLVITTHARILQSCLIGLAYTGFTVVAAVLARRKLARVEIISQK